MKPTQALTGLSGRQATMKLAAKYKQKWFWLESDTTTVHP